MDISFNLEMSDWVAFQQHYVDSSTHFKRLRFVVTCLVPVILMVFLLFRWLTHQTVMFEFFFFSIISILWVVYYPKYFTSRVIKRTQKMIEGGDNSGLLGPHEMIVLPDGIVDKGPQCEFKVTWAGIKQLGENDSYYFLYNTSVSALIIPKKKINTNLGQLDGLLKEYLRKE